MPLTNAQKQARYREARKNGSAHEKRLNLYIDAQAHTMLYGLSKGYAVTMKEVLETVIAAEYKKALRKLEPNSPEWQVFFNVDDQS